MTLAVGLALFPTLSNAQVTAASSQGCEHRILVVTVTDQAGPVTNLDKANFLLESKPTVSEIRAVTQLRQAPRAMVVIDLSESMRTPGKLKIISSLARGFVDAYPANSSLAFLTFDHRVRDRLDFPASKEVLLQKIDAIGNESSEVKGGHTALFDALTEAVQMFDRVQPGDVIFLISDGADNRSHAHMRDVQNLFLERGLRLFCFISVEDNVPIMERRIGRDSLESVAQETGGRSFTLETDSRMWGWDRSKQSLERHHQYGQYMSLLAASGYKLELEVPLAIQKAAPLKLSILGSKGEVKHNMQSLYPRELLPCASPAREITTPE